MFGYAIFVSTYAPHLPRCTFTFHLAYTLHSMHYSINIHQCALSHTSYYLFVGCMFVCCSISSYTLHHHNDPLLVTTTTYIQFTNMIFCYISTAFCNMYTQDVGGQDKIRPLWRHYFAGTQALIFVLDSNDRERVEEARQELLRIINDREMKDAVLLVFANKNDLPNIMDTAEITEKLGLHKLRDHLWHVQSSCATSGDGLMEGLTWLTVQVK